MPRAGLTPSTVVAAALALIDDRGPDALTLASVADRVGVRTPSLYNHVHGLEDLKQRVAAHAMGQLADALEPAVDDDPPALLVAYRQWATDNPSRYALLPMQPAPADALDAPTVAPSVRLVELVTAWAGRFGLHGEDAVHVARALRSALHGFCTIENAGGFGFPVDVEHSFDALVDLLLAGIRATSPAPPDEYR